MSRKFIFTILTLVAIGAIAGLAVFMAKGYRFSPEKGTFSGTGIISITSVPDQASVFLDDHLTTATNANINSLVPKTYSVKIVKEGFIPWEKKIEVKTGLVAEVKARLFPAIPTIYPLTYNGVEKEILSPDGQKLAYIVPGNSKKSGIWVWTMSDRPIAFARGAEPHQIAQIESGLDYSQATLSWSPDSSQVLVTLPDRTLLLEDNGINETPRDITAILEPTLASWEEEVKTKEQVRLLAIKDLNLRKVASSSATLKWAPDETKFLFADEKESEEEEELVEEGKITFKVADIVDKKTYELPATHFAFWLPDSLHVVLVDKDKISVVEFDGFNQAIVYAGTFDPLSVYVWPDSSRLMIVSTFPIPTALLPNLLGINLK